MNIWNTLPKPIMILAPMEDVTDTVFRQIITGCGKPALYFTEFTNVDGLCSNGDPEVSKRLLFTKEEKPLIAQIWGMKPEHYFQATKRLVEMGFDGIDINMGCPQKKVVSRGACSALMKNMPLAAEIIQATKEASGGLPVSVKTRIGYKTVLLEEWIGFLLQQNLAALTVHGRTVAEMSKVPAHWDIIGEVPKLRDSIAPQTLIIGNGDVRSLPDAIEKAKMYNLDGIMVGRGIFENPWLFDPEVFLENVSITKRLALLLTHVALYEKTWGKQKKFQVLKKYFKIYVSSFEGAQELRAKLMETNNGEEVKHVISAYRTHIQNNAILSA